MPEVLGGLLEQRHFSRSCRGVRFGHEQAVDSGFGSGGANMEAPSRRRVSRGNCRGESPGELEGGTMARAMLVVGRGSDGMIGGQWCRNAGSRKPGEKSRVSN